MIIYIRFRNNFKVGFRSMDYNGYWIHRIDACDLIERKKSERTHTQIHSILIRIIQIESYTIYKWRQIPFYHVDRHSNKGFFTEEI